MTLAPWNPRRRATLWLDADTGHGVDDTGAPVRTRGTKRPTLADVLALAEACRVERVMLTGSRPRAGWLLTKAEGWSHGAHHLDHETPVGRYRHAVAPVTVEVRRAVEWFGAGAYSPAEARAAWESLEAIVSAHVPGARLLASPGATGRELWLRSMPRGDAPPQPSSEVAELIRATSGQHRIERFDPPAAGATMPNLYLLDGRLMYAACVRQLGSGGEMMTGHVAAFMLDHNRYARARYHVRATIPVWWEQVGILPLAGEDRETWTYPADPGRTFTTWADAAEVHLALEHGWKLDVLEGIQFTEGRPLDTWAARLLRANDTAAQLEDATQARMVRAGVRWMLLHSIGAWHSTGRTETTVTSGAMRPPAGEGWGAPELQHGRAVWRRRVPITGRAELMAHPEWSAQVWGRARARVLWAPTAVRGEAAGALLVDAGTLVSIYGDAVMTTTLPEWATPAHDDGAPGRLRLKGHHHGPILWPTRSSERDRIMHAADANGPTCENCTTNQGA